MDSETKDTQQPINDKTTDVALLLRYADRYVKEKNYESALECIARARAQDPRNLYALAYEERVRSLVKLKKEREATGAPDPSVSQVFTPALEHLSALAKAEAQRAEAAPVSRSGMAPSSTGEAMWKKEDELRREAIQAKIEMLLKSAESYKARHDFQRALDEVNRALQLEPTRTASRALKDELLKAFEDQLQREELEKRRRAEEEDKRKQELIKAELERVRREKEERQLREDEARRKAQHEKIQQYLDRSRGYLEEGRFESALNELTVVMVIDPMNEAATALQAKIRVRQEQARKEEEERAHQKEEEQKKRRAAIQAAIEKMCTEAKSLAEEGKFADALRVVTRAYVIDPVNAGVQKCEQSITAIREESLRLAEERRRAAEKEEEQRRAEELQRLELEQRERLADGEQAAAEARRKALREEISIHLENARNESARQKYDAALAEIALAFLVDPFDEDVKRTEDEILAAQQLGRREHQTPSTVSEEDTSLQQVDETVRSYLDEAQRLLAAGEYDRALEEITRAFILDPLNDEVQQLERVVDEARKGGTPVKVERPIQAPPPAAPVRQHPPEPVSKVQNHVDQARQHFAAQEYEEALAEIAFGLTLDVTNADLQQLEREIWQVQHAEQIEVPKAGQSDAELRATEERDRLLQIHLLAAEEFQKQNDFARALDEVAKAYVIDPLNPEIKKSEIRIRQNQARHNPPAGQPLKLVYPNERAAGGSR